MNNRKKYIIDKKFQIHMTVTIVLLVVGAITFSGLLTYNVATQLEQQTGKQHYMNVFEKDENVVIVDRLTALEPFLIQHLIIVGLLSILIVSLVMIYYSNRIAGPICHLEKHLNKLLENDYSEKLHFRKNDMFKRISNTVNALQDKLKENSNNSN